LSNPPLDGVILRPTFYFLLKGEIINMIRDPLYIANRTKLIPLAEKVANDKYGKYPKGSDIDKWSKLFHKTMEKLVKEQNIK